MYCLFINLTDKAQWWRGVREVKTRIVRHSRYKNDPAQAKTPQLKSTQQLTAVQMKITYIVSEVLYPPAKLAS